MNNKHLACALLFAVICLLAKLVLTQREKMQEAVESADAASLKLNITTSMRMGAQTALDQTLKQTAPHRKFHDLWKSEFEKSDSEIKAKNLFLQTIKRSPSLVIFDQGMNASQANKEMSFVSTRVGGRAKFEGDFHKTMQMLGSIEREIPTSRIASVEVRKGQRANDVEVDLLVEFPITVPAPAAKP